LNKHVLLSNGENSIFLELVQLLELFVKVTLQLEHDLPNEFNLSPLSTIREQLETLIKQVEDVWALNNLLQVVDFPLLEHNGPVHFFHSFDFPVLLLVFSGCGKIFVGILLLGLGS
jgi:hypothetical protein